MLPGVSGVAWLPIPPGKLELLEEAVHSRDVFALVRVDLGVGSFKIRVGEDSGRAVSGAGDEDRVQVILLDQAIEVNLGEALAGVRAPVAQ